MIEEVLNDLYELKNASSGISVTGDLNSHNAGFVLGLSTAIEIIKKRLNEDQKEKN